MTKQEIFDTVCEHLMKQGGRAYDGDLCKYRDAEGRKCAVGCLIPDELYNPKMEKNLVRSLYDEYQYLPKRSDGEGLFLIANALTVVGIEEEHLPLLKDLQQIHDNGPDTYFGWPRELRTCAEQYGLTAPACIQKKE